MLFIIYIQQVLENAFGVGIEIDMNCLYTLLLADNHIVIASDEEDLAYTLRKLIDED